MDKMTKWQSFIEGLGFGSSSEALKIYSEMSDEMIKVIAGVLVRIYDEETFNLPFSFGRWHYRRRIYRRLLSLLEIMIKRGWGK